MYNTQHFTRDAAVFAFDGEAEGITRDEDDDSVTFDWTQVERVRVDDVPWADSFKSDEFFKLPATVARPIKQTYHFGEDEYALMKPREELKKAAWSLDNAPWTLNHPDTGMVKSVDDIHGFWSNPRYIDSLDDLKANLHIPVHDDEAKAFVEQHGDVSVGFYNTLSRVDEYDGVVGDVDSTDSLDGYQTEIYFDHVASVPVGRCSSDDQCGIDGAPNHGSFESPFISDTRTMNGIEGDTMSAAHDQSKFVNSDDGDWYAVPPQDNPDDEWKFPINDCSDVEDAWIVRGQGDISISQDTLESRIKSRADDLGCEVPEEDALSTDAFESALDRYEIVPQTTENMTDASTDCPDSGIDFGLDELTVDAIAAKHDGVSELVDKLDEVQTDLESKDDEIALKEEKMEKLQAKVDDYEGEQKQALVDDITERTDRFDADDLMEEDLDSVQDKHELVMELSADEKTANGGADAEESETTSKPERQTPW